MKMWKANITFFLGTAISSIEAPEEEEEGRWGIAVLGAFSDSRKTKAAAGV